MMRTYQLKRRLSHNGELYLWEFNQEVAGRLYQQVQAITCWELAAAKEAVFPIVRKRLKRALKQLRDYIANENPRPD